MRTRQLPLYDWLELMDFEEFGSLRMRSAWYLEVSRWLAERPSLQKRLALEGLGRQLLHNDSEASGHRLYRAWIVRSTIFGAGAPDDFAEWCLHQAVDGAETRLEVALALLEWSRPWHDGDGDSGVSIADVRASTKDVPALRRQVELILTPPPESKELLRLREEDGQHRLESRDKKRPRQSSLHTFASMRAGAARRPVCAGTPALHIAQAYHDFFRRQRLVSPLMRVTELLDGNVDLAEAAIEGFRHRHRPPGSSHAAGNHTLETSEVGCLSLAYPLARGLSTEMGPESVDSRSPTEDDEGGCALQPHPSQC